MNYRGSIKLRFKKINKFVSFIKRTFLGLITNIEFKNVEYKEYNIGDKIGQLIIIPYPEIQFNEISKLSDTDRGDGGFGSTDAKAVDAQEAPSKPRRKRKSSK